MTKHKAASIYRIIAGALLVLAALGLLCAQTGSAESPAGRESISDPPPPVVFGNVQNVALLNTWGNDGMPSLTNDGRRMVFSSRRLPIGNDWDIWSSERIGGIWQTPVLLPEQINSGYETSDSEISPDGTRLFFTVSGHPQGYGGKDIWASQRAGLNWSNMINLGPLVNTVEDETGPSANEDGTELYFCRSVAGLGADIFVLRWMNDAWQPPEPVSVVNSLENESSPQIAEHGTMLYFVRGTLIKQVMVSRRFNDQWQSPEPVIIENVINPIDPFVTADGNQIFFGDKLSLLNAVFGNGTQDIYMATRQGAPPRAEVTLPRNDARLAGDFITVSAELSIGNPGDVSQVLFQAQTLDESSSPSDNAWTDLTPMAPIAAPNPAPNPPYRTFFNGCDFPEGRLALRAVAFSTDGTADPAPDYVVFRVDRETTEEIEGRPCLGLSNVLASTALHRKIAAAYADRQNVVGLARPNHKLMISITLDYGALGSNTLFYIGFHDPGTWDPATVNPIQIAQNFTATVELFYPDADDDGYVDGTGVEEKDLLLRVFVNGAWRPVDATRYIINTVQNKLVAKVGTENKQTQNTPDKLTAVDVYSEDKGSVGGEVEVSKSLGGAMIACSLRDNGSSNAIENGVVSVLPSVTPPVSENESGVYTLFVSEGNYSVTGQAPDHDNASRSVYVSSMQMKSIALFLQSASPEGEGSYEGGPEGLPEGGPEGLPEGGAEGLPEGGAEGLPEGGAEGLPEGGAEGLPEGSVEGEGAQEGEPGPHSIDIDGDGLLNLGEVLRGIQFFNFGGFCCASPPESTEDGYVPGMGTDHSCQPHDADYAPRDWRFSLGELLRIIQFFNMGGYRVCEGTEDGFCPGLQ